MANSKTYDLFLSYSRKDEAFVKTLNADLKQRGVVTFLDQFDIDPGVLFEQTIFSDIANSRAYGLVVTSNSLGSSWVQREYSHAKELFDEGQIRIIPLLWEQHLSHHPLASHNGLPFWDSAKYQENISRLIFPGIIAKEISVVTISNYTSPGHRKLAHELARHGMHGDPAGSVHRGEFALQNYLSHFVASRRLVVCIDLFDEEYESLDQKLKFLLKYRELTRDSAHEVVFVLTHESRMLQTFSDRISQAFGVEMTDRLNHYFQLHTDLSEREFDRQFDSVWGGVQRELMRVRG